MSYTAGVITNDAQWSNTLMSAIEGALGAHSAWSFVENQVVGTYTTRVWKNSGSHNSWGQDFYIWFARTTSGIGTSTISFGAMEGYSTSTGNITRGTSFGSGTFTADSTYHAIPAYSGVPVPAALINGYYCINGDAINSFVYRIFVSKDRIIVWSLAHAYSQYNYVGLFEPLWNDLPTEFPLISIYYQGGGFSRCPFRGQISSRNQPGYYYSSGGGPAMMPVSNYFPAYGTLGSSYDGLQNGVMGARLLVRDVNAPAAYGTGDRGHLYGMLGFNAPSYSPGDTITVDGVQYVRGATNAIWASVED